MCWLLLNLLYSSAVKAVPSICVLKGTILCLVFWTCAASAPNKTENPTRFSLVFVCVPHVGRAALWLSQWVIFWSGKDVKRNKFHTHFQDAQIHIFIKLLNTNIYFLLFHLCFLCETSTWPLTWGILSGSERIMLRMFKKWEEQKSLDEQIQSGEETK